MNFPPIKIKATPEILNAICSLFDATYYPALEVRAVRSKLNIIQELGITLQKKQLDKPKGSKPFTLKFKYYEADALEEFMRTTVDFIADEFDQALVHGFMDNLHQRLA